MFFEPIKEHYGAHFVLVKCANVEVSLCCSENRNVFFLMICFRCFCEEKTDLRVVTIFFIVPNSRFSRD